jgi:hypothetical protein
VGGSATPALLRAKLVRVSARVTGLSASLRRLSGCGGIQSGMLEDLSASSPGAAQTPASGMLVEGRIKGAADAARAPGGDSWTSSRRYWPSPTLRADQPIKGMDGWRARGASAGLEALTELIQVTRAVRPEAVDASDFSLFLELSVIGNDEALQFG